MPLLNILVCYVFLWFCTVLTLLRSEQRRSHCFPCVAQGWRCCVELDRSFSCIPHGQLVRVQRFALLRPDPNNFVHS